MQAEDIEGCCSECSNRMVDAGEEMVCPRCGVVREKEVVEVRRGGSTRAKDLGSQALGSYMGPRGASDGEKFAHSLSSSNSRYSYLKLVSDYAGRSDGSASLCFKMIERVMERLYLPPIVFMEAASIAQKVLQVKGSRRRITVAAVSAYSLVAACKAAGVTSVSAREILAVHAGLGRHVSSSSIIQLMLESPVKTAARRPEDYVGRVLARLSTCEDLDKGLAEEGVPKAQFLHVLRKTALEVLSRVDEGGRVGRRPCALAASAVYSAETVLSACESRKKRITQRLAAECGDAAEYTIREQCAEVFPQAVSSLIAQRRQTLPPAFAP